MNRNTTENKHSSEGGIGAGFLLGFLLGVLLTLLLTTKKGREILRDLMDKLIQKIASIDKPIVDTAKHGEERSSDYVKPSPEEIKKEVRYLAAASAGDNSEEADGDACENGVSKGEKLHQKLFLRRGRKKN